MSAALEWLLPTATLNNEVVKITFEILLPMKICPEVELLDYVVIPFSMFGETIIL